MIGVRIDSNFEEWAGTSLEGLLEVPASIWDAPMLYLMQQIKERPKKIRRKRVSKKTIKWRKDAVKVFFQYAGSSKK